jgi:hypothetical protein
LYSSANKACWDGGSVAVRYTICTSVVRRVNKLRISFLYLEMESRITCALLITILSRVPEARWRLIKSWKGLQFAALGVTRIILAKRVSLRLSYSI